jgi:hypothetical protein
MTAKCWATNVGCAASLITPLLMVLPLPVQSQQLPHTGALPTKLWRCRCASLAHLCAACSSICTSYTNITKQQAITHMHSPPPSPGVLAPPRRCLRSSLAIRFPLSKRTVHTRTAATAAVLVFRSCTSRTRCISRDCLHQTQDHCCCSYPLHNYCHCRCSIVKLCRHTPLSHHQAAAAATVAAGAPTCVDRDPCAVDWHVLAVTIITRTTSAQLGKCKANSHEQITPAHEHRAGGVRSQFGR